MRQSGRTTRHILRLASEAGQYQKLIVFICSNDAERGRCFKILYEVLTAAGLQPRSSSKHSISCVGTSYRIYGYVPDVHQFDGLRGKVDCDHYAMESMSVEDFNRFLRLVEWERMDAAK